MYATRVQEIEGQGRERVQEKTDSHVKKTTVKKEKKKPENKTEKDKKETRPPKARH